MKKLAVLLLAATASYAQTNWRKVGGVTFDAGLASPATGPVAEVWFSPEGGKLYVRTVSGGTWETADFENWSPAAAPAAHPAYSPSNIKPPEAARTIASAGGTVFALGANLLRSDDNGHTWTNLTAFNGRAVIGAGQNDLAVSPRDPQSLFVANAWGVWASHDGGLSWSGLNENLPNLSITRIESVANGATGVKATLSGLGASVLAPGASTWEPLGAGADYSALSKTLNAAITAVAASGDTVYAGSADGRIWVSRDSQTTWTLSPSLAGGPIDAISVAPAASNIAFIASSGKTRSILRTIDSGQFWDDITGTLLGSLAHGIAADRSSGAIYVATDRGVFLAHADLNALGTVSPWTSLSGLPNTPARDVKLDGTRIYAALEGYGVYSATAPGLAGSLRVVSAADLTERAAAPGALFSVVGGKIQSARAGNLTVPVLASASEESQIQVPFEATGTQLSLTLDRTTMTLPLQAVSPAIFLDHDGGPILLDAESGLSMDAKSSLRPNMRLQILVTGLGKTSPNWPTALPAPAENPPAVSASVQMFLGDRPLTVTRATLAPGYVGLYLVEMEIPAILDSGAADLYLAAEGVESNRVRVYVTTEN